MSTHSISAPAAAGNYSEYTPMPDPLGIGAENYPPLPTVSARSVVAHARRERDSRAALAMLLAAATMATSDDDRAYLLEQADAAERAMQTRPVSAEPEPEPDDPARLWHGVRNALLLEAALATVVVAAWNLI